MTSHHHRQPMQQPVPPVPMVNKVIAIPELHAEIASYLYIYHFASCALVSKKWHQFWNPYVWSSIINRHPQDNGCTRYGHLVRHFHAVLLSQDMRATAMAPVSLDVIRQHCLGMKSVTLLGYSISSEDFGHQVMDIRDYSPPTGSYSPGMEPVGGAVPRLSNGFLSNTIHSMTLTLPFDVGRLALHRIVLAGRQARLQGLVQLEIGDVSIRPFQKPPMVSANNIQACTFLFPNLRKFNTSLHVGNPEEDEGDMYSGEGARQLELQSLSLTSLWSSTALPFIIRPLHLLYSLTIGGYMVEQPFLAQIPRYCPRLTHFKYIGWFNSLGAPPWTEFLGAYGSLTSLYLNKTGLANAVISSLPRFCPLLQHLFLPRQKSQITWQAVSALVEHLAQLRVLNVTALSIQGEFFGTRVHLDAKVDEGKEGGGSGGTSEVVLKPWACQDTLQELTLHNVFLSDVENDYELFRRRIWSLRQLRHLGIFGDAMTLECFVEDVKEEVAKQAEKTQTGDDHTRFPLLETFNIPEFETPMGLAEAQALFGQMPRLKEPKLPCVSFVREAEEWFTKKYGEVEDSDDDWRA